MDPAAGTRNRQLILTVRAEGTTPIYTLACHLSRKFLVIVQCAYLVMSLITLQSALPKIALIAQRTLPSSDSC